MTFSHVTNYLPLDVPYCATLKLFRPLGFDGYTNRVKVYPGSRDRPVKLGLGLGLGLVTSPYLSYRLGLDIGLGLGLGFRVRFRLG